MELNARQYSLKPFHDSEYSLSASMKTEGGLLTIEYTIHGPFAKILFPSPENSPSRLDNLWQHTCCEFFWGPAEGPSYVEANYSPSGNWAYYRFKRYRVRDNDPDFSAPQISCSAQKFHWTCQVQLYLHELMRCFTPVESFRMGLSVIIEQRSGFSYFALDHNPEKPDFHAASAFIVAPEGIGR